jgi:hypothetical protein
MLEFASNPGLLSEAVRQSFGVGVGGDFEVPVEVMEGVFGRRGVEGAVGDREK